MSSIFNHSIDSGSISRLPICSFGATYNWFRGASFLLDMHAERCRIRWITKLVGHKTVGKKLMLVKIMKQHVLSNIKWQKDPNILALLRIQDAHNKTHQHAPAVLDNGFAVAAVLGC